jgi:hypothetical protein
MLNLIDWIKVKHQIRKNSKTRENFKTLFYSQKEHSWIQDNQQAQEKFDGLFELLPETVLSYFTYEAELIFVPSGIWRENKQLFFGKNIIVIFPEFQKLMQKKDKTSVAYLAHEVAMILHEHKNEKLDPLMCEVEADKFVCDLGLSLELEKYLLNLDECLDKRVRLSYLTSFVLGQDH